MAKNPGEDEMAAVKRESVLACIMAFVLAAMASWTESAASQEAKAPQKDYLQRSLEIYEFKKAAASGPERGQEIFYYKCWFCHNEYTKDIPKLDGLNKKANLLSGQPISDETVKEQIRNGSAGMASYKYTLSETDLNDLVSYLREKCCWNSDAPPHNPRYRAN
jgi:cytochrome c5